MLKRSLRKAELRPPHVLTVWNSISETELSQFRISDMIGDYSVGCYFESLAKSENKAFLERFRKRYGAKERVNDTMETAYFGVHLWKLACEKAHSTDTKAVREALRGLTVDSPEGTIQIDKSNQHAYRTARIGEIVETNGQGAFEIVYSSPKPLQAEAFPQGQTEDQWKSFLDGLFQKWGNKWERHP
jgi:urea transport system substrate-binding protein